ncbi:hypothetical protein HNY73_017431 [Argiope bruennichi]|uniref:Uncharacterized protein n=1 Tax=Argiope bruennichi TaxID=94029 RepID=A0A8T0EDM6_ARGBR|nr:hypothetical protein HNY73_017431 [Argiope bruennichi]
MKKSPSGVVKKPMLKEKSLKEDVTFNPREVSQHKSNDFGNFAVLDQKENLHCAVMGERKNITMILADGKDRNLEALTVTVNLSVEGKIVRVQFIALPEAKGNRTLLGTDFLQAAGIVLNIENDAWHFSENSYKQFSFYKNPSTIKENQTMISSHKVTSPETIPVTLQETPVSETLREDEGKHLTSKQRVSLNSLVK